MKDSALPAALEHLRCVFDRGILTVTLDRGSVNAVNQDMYGELVKVFRGVAEATDDIRVVILTSAGRHFCGGNDLDEFEDLSPANVRERMFHVREAFWSVLECPVPVIGAVAGAALGTGLALAASCDFVVADTTARFGLPEIQVGVMGGARHLARLVPQPMVRKMFFTGEPVPAAELARVGGIVDVVEAGEALSRAGEIAARVSGFSPTALRLAKRTLNQIEHAPLKQGYELEQDATGVMCTHPDSKEAVAAWRAGRAPVFARAGSGAGGRS